MAQCLGFRSVKENKQCEYMVDKFNLTKIKMCFSRKELKPDILVNLITRSVECG